MKRALILATCLSLTGCYTMRFSGQQVDDDAVFFTQVAGSHEEHFKESETIGYMFWGGLAMGSPDPGRVLGRYVGSGRKIANFRIVAEQSFTDGLLGLLTLGIYSPLTVTYEGDVVKPRLEAKGKHLPTGAVTGPTNNNSIVVQTGGSAGGQAGGNGNPAAPVITALMANPTSARPGQSVALMVNAMSPGGKALRYQWSASGGVLSSTSGGITFWSAPERPGAYGVAVSVTDDAGGQAAGAVTIVVAN